MKSVDVPRRWANLVLFLFFLALSIAAYSITGGFPSPLIPGYPGSAMFPQLILVVMGCICSFGVVRCFVTKQGGVAANEATVTFPLVPFLLIIGALLGFAGVMLIAGAEMAIFVFIAGAVWLRTRRTLVSVGAGAASVVVVYLLFVQALSVSLPLQFLPRYLF
jgi:hypothetical protein